VADFHRLPEHPDDCWIVQSRSVRHLRLRNPLLIKKNVWQLNFHNMNFPKDKVPGGRR